MAFSSSKVSVKWLLPPLLVLPVVIVAGVLTWLAYTTGKRSADDLANQNMQQIHSRIEEHLTRLMNMPPAINELHKRMLAKGQLSLTDVDGDRVPVFETLNIFQAVSSVVISKAAGQTMWVIRYPGEMTYEYAIKRSPDAPMFEYPLGESGEIVGEALSEYKYHPTVRPWYKAAIAADGPTWGEVYIWVRGGKGETLGVPYVEPIRDADGNILGVINCEMTLSDISMYLARLQVGKTGKAFIIEPDGNLVATGVEIECMKVDEAGAPARLPASEASDAWIVQAEAELRQRHGSLDSIVESTRLAIQVNGRPMRLVVSPYTNRRNLRWLIVTLVPDSDFLADVKANRSRSLLVGIAAVALMLGVSVALVITMMRPFLKLVAHVRRIGEGHVDHRLSLGGTREMARLSHEINEMAEGLQDRLRLRQALALAMEVQQNLLPTNIPKIKGLDLAGRSTYCDETGGDYYDYLDVSGLSDDTVAVAIGDVAGHGIAAAMLMATARGMLVSHCDETGSLGELLTHLNDHLVKDVGTGTGRFMTMLLMTVDTEHKEVRWASAGHDPPIVYDPQSDEFLPFDLGGVPLGILAEQAYQEHAFGGLRAGQIYLAGTDGIWETDNIDGEMYGKGRLCELIRANADQTAEEISDRLREELTGFRGESSQDDDITFITFVVVKVTSTT
ncbi:MAG: SpoIIE family protein phosphatase [Planctomycetota bacterium]|jgi:serine phosphatase RsbU (regulator of sigma subunit)